MTCFSIPVLTRMRRIRVHPVNGVNLSNLLPVPKQPQNASVEITPTLTVKLALQNVRSLTNKPFLINDFICTHKLDFMLLTETWLEQSHSSITLIEAAPPHFDFISAARLNKRGGGIANIFRASFQYKQISLGNFTSFEYLSAVLKCTSGILLLTIYRPPRLSATVFLEEFGELLSNICLEFDSLIISGDFNFHVDNLENTYASEFLTLIDTFNLTQHVQGPTHSHGHTLDLVITKGLNVSTSVMDLGLSDHFCVFFDVCMSPLFQNKSMTVRKRVIKNDTGVLFEQALSELPSQPSDCADDLMANFNLRMIHIMDTIAPLKTKSVTEKQKAPWKLNPTVKLLKRECRKTERKWRKSKLQIHFQIHREMLCKYNLEISKARQSFFSDIINRNINNARVLFSTVEKLTNPSRQMPYEFFSVNKCNDFASFFKGKIDKIRMNIATQVQTAQNVESLATERRDLNQMPTFNLIDNEILKKNCRKSQFLHI